MICEKCSNALQSEVERRLERCSPCITAAMREALAVWHRYLKRGNRDDPSGPFMPVPYKTFIVDKNEEEE